MSAAEDAALIQLEDAGGYAVVTINRPEKRNAINTAMQVRLTEIFRSTAHRYNAVVLVGSGAVFCAGVDTRERFNLAGSEVPARSIPGSAEFDSWLSVQDAIITCPAVVIAAVNGFALGGGLTLVNSADLAIAAATAQFGIPEIGLGVIPALSGPSTVHRILPKHVGYLAYTGERISAGDAARYGLVNEVVAPGEELVRSRVLAQRLSGFDAAALDYTKRTIREAARLDYLQALDYGVAHGAVLRGLRAAATTSGDR